MRHLPALLACLLLSGCLHDGDVGRYRAVLDGKGAPAVPAFDPAAPLSLGRALQVANADNEQIAEAGENFVQALAEKLREAGTFLPTVSLAPTYNLTHGGSGGFLIGGVSGLSTGSSGTTSTGGGTTGTGSASTGGSVQITSAAGSTVSHQFSIPLGATGTASLSNVSAFQSAGQTVAQREQQLLDERETILLQVVQSYYTVLKSERQQRVYESSLRSKAEKVRDQEARQTLGNVRPLDVAQSQADLAATRVQLTQARTAAYNARSSLARLMGVPSVDGPLTDTFSPPADVAPLAQWQRTAAARRQDLVAAVAAEESARYKVEGAIREYFPSVSINFNYFLYNDPSSSQRWTGGLSGNIPIFSALTIEADVRSAWSVYRQAGQARSQTARQVTDDVNENYQNLQDARAEIADLTVQQASAQNAVDLAERAYTLGSESNLDRLTQQDNLLSAELNLVTQQYNEKAYYLGLLRASGGLATALPGRGLPTTAPATRDKPTTGLVASGDVSVR